MAQLFLRGPLVEISVCTWRTVLDGPTFSQRSLGRSSSSSSSSSSSNSNSSGSSTKSNGNHERERLTDNRCVIFGRNIFPLLAYAPVLEKKESDFF